ncbi:PAS domain protein [Beggiatoa sp. SS]|nr:PAS domain protein [Beggiatoa sp. SS]
MERLKDNPETRHIPVHFVSGSDHKMTAKKMGAIGYLLKPVNMEQLGEAFQKIEEFISTTVKNLLIVVDNDAHQQQMLDMIKSDDIQITLATSKAMALKHLEETAFDCLILDIDIEQRSGIKLIEQIVQQKALRQTPLILYVDRELTAIEEGLLLQCEEHITIKSVRSPVRLLDEATLFLHQVEAKLPEDKRKMLRMVHDKAAILKNKKVLIVDDDTRNVFALATVLEDNDMEVVCGQNGKEGVAVLEKQNDIDLILMDIMMPEMDGYEAMRKIRAQVGFRKIPIIALTAKAMKGDKAKWIEAGANDLSSPTRGTPIN